jgi:hypothetical protein
MYSQARDLLLETVILDREHPRALEAHLGLAQIYKRQGLVEESKNQLETVLRRNAGDIDALLHAGSNSSGTG